MRPRRETCAEHRSVMERILVRSSTHSWRYFPHLCQQGQADKKYGVERPTFPVASVKLQPILCVKKYPACSNPLSSISSNTLNNKAVVKSITYIYIYTFCWKYQPLTHASRYALPPRTQYRKSPFLIARIIISLPILWSPRERGFYLI